MLSGVLNSLPQPCPGKKVVSEMHTAFPTTALQPQPQKLPRMRLPPSDSPFSSLSPPSPSYLITASYFLKLSPYSTRSSLYTQQDCDPLTASFIPNQGFAGEKWHCLVVRWLPTLPQSTGDVYSPAPQSSV